MKINQLTTSEELLMTILWKLGSAYMKDVIENYPEPKPHQNTISTFIKILVEKDFLTTEKHGRIFKYTVAVPFENYRRYLLKNFVDHYFDGSGLDLLKTLTEERLIHPTDIKGLFEIETTLHPITEPEQKNTSAISDYIAEITAPKKPKKKEKKEKKKKKKGKNLK